MLEAQQLDPPARKSSGGAALPAQPPSSPVAHSGVRTHPLEQEGAAQAAPAP